MKSAPYLIILAALLWSLDGLLRQHLYSLPPETIVFLEHALGFAVLAPIAIKEFRTWKGLSGKTWYSVFAIALLGGAIGTIAYTGALGRVNYISLSVVVLLQQLQPVFAIALAGLLLKEKITKNFLLLALLAIVAAYFVSFPNLRVNFATGGGTIIAAILAVVAAFSWGASTALGRYALNKLSFVSLSSLRYALTTGITFLFLLSTGKVDTIGALSGTQWWYLIAIVFSTGLIALLIYYRGLAHVPARVSTVLEMFWPLSAIFIDWMVNGNTLTATQWAGALVLLAIIFKISRDAQLQKEADMVPVGPES